MVHLRSSPDLTPDAVKLRLFRNAHHTGSLPAQLTVVWWLLPEAATGGPTSISIAVTSRPTLLSCHTCAANVELVDYIEMWKLFKDNSFKAKKHSHFFG